MTLPIATDANSPDPARCSASPERRAPAFRLPARRVPCSQLWGSKFLQDRPHACPQRQAWRPCAVVWMLLAAGMMSVAAGAEANTSTASPSSITTLEWDGPETSFQAALWAIVVLAALLWVIRWYRRDVVEISRWWIYPLAGLRLLVLAGLLLIALNPHERTQRSAFRPSRVAVLADTSLSMRHAALDVADPASVSGAVSRSDAVRSVLADSPLLAELAKTHDVQVYTFSRDVAGPVATIPYAGSKRIAGTEAAALGDSTRATEASPQKTSSVDWSQVLAPQGVETRLGDALEDVFRQAGGRTLSGIVLLTDGASNAGADARPVRDRLVANGSSLTIVGVGGTAAPLNLRVAEIQSPTEIQLGDQFTLTTFLQAEGLANQRAAAELLLLGANDEPPSVLDRRDVDLPADGAPVEVQFSQTPTLAGAARYAVRAIAPPGAREATLDDNLQSVSVTALDRPVRVLLFAGGPMRDYQFVRNLFFRHKSFDVDVLLQTAGPGTSQESNRLLPVFPERREDLFQYDVLLAFDPDWSKLSAETVRLVSEWVYQEAGGVAFIAGEVNTPGIANEQIPGDPSIATTLRELYPVVLSSYFSDAPLDAEAAQPWPLDLSRDGLAAEFLHLTDDAESSLARWKEFPGFYRCFPVQGPKAGSTVYAKLADPRLQNGAVLAGQFFGQGRSFYIGSAEFWRLRSVSDEDYDRFWTKLARELGQGRLKRGARRGLLLPESRKATLGQTIRVRARFVDPQFQPWVNASAPWDVFDPSGRPLASLRPLVPDPGRPGEYTGEFRAASAGAFRIEAPIPDSRDRVVESISVGLPKLEDENIRQNVSLLKELASPSDAYLTLDQAASRIPSLLKDRGEPFQVDERLKTLWDRAWTMYGLVALLSLEWLLRKILKLA